MTPIMPDVLTEAQQVLKLSGVVKRPNPALVRIAQAVVDLSATLAARDAALQALEVTWTKEREAYAAGSTDRTVGDMNRASAETCRRFLLDLARLRATLAPQAPGA